MSSILNALKKLESEQSRSGEKPVWPERIDSRRTIRRWEIHSGRFTPTLWLVLIAVIGIAGGWGWNYWRGGENDATEASTAVRARIVEPLPAPALPMETPAVDNESIPAALKPPVSRLPRNRKVAVAPTPVTEAPAPKTGAPVRTATAGKVEETASRSEPNPSEILTEGFELQAISWSERTEDRIAVINGTIVREGAILDGYRVARIEPEEVIVSKADRRWRLVFLSR